MRPARPAALLVVATALAGCQAPGSRVGDIYLPPTPAPRPDVETPDVEEPVDPPPPPTQDPPDGPGTPPEDPPTPPQDPPTPTGDQACFPGADLTWSTCLPTVAGVGGADYAYPAPLNGSAQYAAPARYLDLQAHPGSTLLAPNFRLDEIAQPYKGRYAVVQPHAVDRLQDLRDQLGALVVNSGYRPPGYNATIGGATWSRHMYGDAFDIDPVSASLGALQSACYAHGAAYVGVYTSHMHCDWRNDPLADGFYGPVSSSAFQWVPDLDAALRIEHRPVGGGRVARVLSAPATGWDEGEPLREWTAFDAEGWAIATGVGDTWEPPPEAASVEVWIGRELVRTLPL